MRRRAVRLQQPRRGDGRDAGDEDGASAPRARGDTRARCDWTRSEDLALIDAHSRAVSVEQIACELGRTACGVYSRAMTLGLPLGKPDGFESITVLARELGYQVRQLVSILRWAHVRIYRGWCNPSTPYRQRGGRVVARIVERFEAEQAVARWHETATLQAWVRELQPRLSHDMLSRRARLRGHRPVGRGKRCHYRLTRQQFEDLLWTATLGRPRRSPGPGRRRTPDTEAPSGYRDSSGSTQQVEAVGRGA